MGMRVGWCAIPDFEAQDGITPVLLATKGKRSQHVMVYESSLSAWLSYAQKIWECNVLCAKLLLPALIRRATRCADFETGCQMLHKALLQLQHTIRRIAQSKAARKSQTNAQM